MARPNELNPGTEVSCRIPLVLQTTGEEASEEIRHIKRSFGPTRVHKYFSEFVLLEVESLFGPPPELVHMFGTYVQFGIAHTKNLECVHLPK